MMKIPCQQSNEKEEQKIHFYFPLFDPMLSTNNWCAIVPIESIVAEFNSKLFSALNFDTIEQTEWLHQLNRLHVANAQT